MLNCTTQDYKNNATIEISSFQLAYKKADNLLIEDLYKELNNTNLDEEKLAIEKLIREKEEKKFDYVFQI